MTRIPFIVSKVKIFTKQPLLKTKDKTEKPSEDRYTKENSKKSGKKYKHNYWRTEKIHVLSYSYP
jgi:hypothetical protein